LIKKGVIIRMNKISKCCLGRVAFERELMVSIKKRSKVYKEITRMEIVLSRAQNIVTQMGDRLQNAPTSA
jgi:hypothetical protein